MSGAPSTWGIPAVSFASGPTGTTGNIWSNFGDLGGDGPYVVTDPTLADRRQRFVGDRQTFAAARVQYNRQTFNQLGNQFSRGQFASEPLAASSIGDEESDHRSGYRFPEVTRSPDFLLGNLQSSTVAVAVADANAKYVRNVEIGFRRGHLQGFSQPHDIRQLAVQAPSSSME